MQKKRLSLMLAAGAIAGMFTMAQAPEANACLPSQNTILIYNEMESIGHEYCKAIDNDIQINRIARSVRYKGIVWARVRTEGEPGTCTFYLITAQEKLHRRFNIGDGEDESTFARPNTYFGFRLGC